MAVPLVLVHQELAAPQVVPATPDLNTLIVGPAYDLRDYPDDAADILLDTAYGTLDAAPGGATPYVPPATGEDVLTVQSYPGASPGAVVDHDSVRVFLRTPRVVLGSTNASVSPVLGTGVTTDVDDQTLIALSGTLINFVTAGIQPGDIAIISSSGVGGVPQTVQRIVASVGEPNAGGLVPSGNEGYLRVSRNLPEPSTRATGSIKVVAGASLVDGETVTVDDGASPAVIFEFNSGGGVSGSNVAVAFTGGDSAATVRTALLAALSGAGLGMTFTADPDAADVILIENDLPGTAGNVTITDTVTNVGFVCNGMSGGYSSADTWDYGTAEIRFERQLSTRELEDPSRTYITFPEPGLDTMTLKGGVSLNVAITPAATVAVPSPSTTTASRKLSYSEVYLAYRALRQDLQQKGSVAGSDVISRAGFTTINGVGKLDARNPLAAALFVALQNAGAAPVYFYGVNSDDAGGHANARDAVSSDRDIHCVVPLTTDINILAGYKFEADQISDPSFAQAHSVTQKFRMVIGSAVLPSTTTVFDGSISGDVSAQPSGTGTGHYRTLSFAYASAVNVSEVLPGDTVIIGQLSASAATSWQGRRGSHTVSHVNRTTDGVALGTLFEIDPGSSRWDSAAGSTAADIELLIRAPDGTVRVSKMGSAAILINAQTATWTSKVPTVVGGPYTVRYVAGATFGVAISGFAVTVTYVSGVTTHQNVVDAVAAHATLSTLFVVTLTGNAVLNSAVAATAVRPASGLCTASVIVNDLPYLRLEDASAQFISAGVKPGDTLELPFDPNDYTAGAYASGRVDSFVIAQVLNENRLLVVNQGDNTATATRELPHLYNRHRAGQVLDITAPNALNYRIRRKLSKDDQVLALIATAASFRTKRVVMVYPDRVDVAGLRDASLPRSIASVPASAGSMPGWMIAAQVGGAMAGLPVQYPLTHLGLAGISRLYHSTGYFNETQLGKLSDGGLFVMIQPSPTALPYCLHQLTTDITAIETGEVSVVRNVDFLSLYLQRIMEAFLQGYNVLPETNNAMFRALSDGAENLTKRRIAKIGPPLLSGEVTSLKVSDTAGDRYEIRFKGEVPRPVNGVDLYVLV